MSVRQLCSPLWFELMVKLRTLLTVFILKAEAAIMERGVTFPRACGVRPITIHCASWPIRADCACRKEGLYERGICGQGRCKGGGGGELGPF